MIGNPELAATPPKPKQTIFDGPNKIKKRWTIGIAALLGLLQTIDTVPKYVFPILQAVIGAVHGS